jgi:Reverse transcriptase (RNA-dependent DNA polymerase)
LIRKNGHAYYQWHTNNSVLFTQTELHRMHLHFFHPSAQKLYSLIRRARPDQATSATRALLDDIAKSCRTCQHLSRKPYHFHVSIPGDCIFNQTVAMDLMWLEGRAVLHVVDTSLHFNSAAFLMAQTVEGIWTAFLDCWCTLYLGYPDKLRVDSGSVFTSTRFAEITGNAGISLQVSGVESHNSLGSGERYHEPLRRTYLKVRMDYPQIQPQLALRLAIKALNDTAGPEGLVPSLLVFGVLPRFPVSHTQLPDQQTRMAALSAARAEAETITAELRLRLASSKPVPAAATAIIEPGMQVLVHRDNSYAAVGPLRVVSVDQKQAWVIDDSGRTTKFSISQLRPYVATVSPRHADSTYITNLVDLLSSFYRCTADVPSDIHVTTSLTPGDPRYSSAAAAAARAAEIDGLIKRDTWEVVRKRDLPADANVLCGRFVMTIKNIGTPEEMYKARFVVQGHKDREKAFLTHNSATLRHSSVKLLVSIAAIMGFRIWTHDVTQAYTQAADCLVRDVYLDPKQDRAAFPHSSDQVLKLRKPLYGLSDAGDYWQATLGRHMRADLKMHPTAGDISMFYRRVQDRLSGLAGTVVDDSLLAGDQPFLQHTDKSLQRFDSKPRRFAPTPFAGVDILLGPAGSYILSQTSYAQRMTALPRDCNFDSFRSRRAQLAWLTYTRPEIVCAVNTAAQVTCETFCVETVTALNSAIGIVLRNPTRGLQYHSLDLATLRIVAYSDAAFACNRDLTSQLGFIVFLVDSTMRCNIVHYSSKKARRVTRSVMGAEALAFCDALDFSYTLRHDLERMLQQNVPLSILTDSRQVFDIITQSSPTAERRLMIDVLIAREMYSARELSDIGRVESNCNPADALTKAGPCSALDRILDRGILDLPVIQWIIRQPAKSVTAGR